MALNLPYTETLGRGRLSLPPMSELGSHARERLYGRQTNHLRQRYQHRSGSSVRCTPCP